MKKFIISIVIVFLVIVIYLFNLDRKVFFVTMVDNFILEKKDLGFINKGYNSYVADYLSNKKKLEKYVNTYTSRDLRVNDIINDINNNKKIVADNKNYTIKNLLIKADLVTISINNNDIYNKFTSGYNTSEIYTWVDELLKDYENLFTLLRLYCKEKIFLIGPSIIKEDSDLNKIISYLNESLKSISRLYNIEYIDFLEIIKLEDDSILEYNSTKIINKLIGEEIIKKINK